MPKPFHTWVDFFKRLGLRPAGNALTPPAGYKKRRYLRLEKLSPRHMLTVDVFGGGLPHDAVDGRSVHEVWVQENPEQSEQQFGQLIASSSGEPTRPILPTRPDGEAIEDAGTAPSAAVQPEFADSGPRGERNGEASEPAEAELDKSAVVADASEAHAAVEPADESSHRERSRLGGYPPRGDDAELLGRRRL